jgi:hypothetical protein
MSAAGRFALASGDRRESGNSMEQHLSKFRVEKIFLAALSRRGSSHRSSSQLTVLIDPSDAVIGAAA